MSIWGLHWGLQNLLEVLHTMTIAWEDKGFQHFDSSRMKVCHLGLHIKGQKPKNNALQSTYMAALFVSFGAKVLAGG
jgi:hypothetical protein